VPETKQDEVKDSGVNEPKPVEVKRDPKEEKAAKERVKREQEQAKRAEEQAKQDEADVEVFLAAHRGEKVLRRNGSFDHVAFDKARQAEKGAEKAKENDEDSDED